MRGAGGLFSQEEGCQKEGMFACAGLNGSLCNGGGDGLNESRDVFKTTVSMTFFHNE